MSKVRAVPSHVVRVEPRYALAIIAVIGFLLLPLVVLGVSPSSSELARRGITVGSADTSVFIEGRVVESRQGKDSNGGTIPKAVSDPTVVVRQELASTEFYAMGIGGEVVVEFPSRFVDGPGADVMITERTWGEPSSERARVFVSDDGVSWTSLGLADNATASQRTPDTISRLDLSGLEQGQLRFVKLVDATKPVGVASQNGFDAASIRVLHAAK